MARARLGQDAKLGAIRRLDEQARRLERHASGPSVADLIDQEFRDSHSYGGRSVFGWEPSDEPAQRVSGETRRRA